MTRNHQVAGSNPAGGLLSNSVSWSKEDIKNVIRDLKLAGDTERYIRSVERRLNRFSREMSYSCNLDDIIIYINEIKSKYSYSELHKTVLAIRMLMREIRAPFASRLKLPKRPKRRKLVIKRQRISSLLEKIDAVLTGVNKLRLKSCILLGATSGLRAEELYRLTLDDINVDERIIYIKAEVAKDFEDRVTFFTEEAKAQLLEYLENISSLSKLRLFSDTTIRRTLRYLQPDFKIKFLRKFFSQQSDRLGMPTAVKKILLGHALSGDVDLVYYDFQDEEELKKIYDKYWRDFSFSDQVLQS